MYSNKKKSERELLVGDRVIFKNHGKKHKLELNFLGPATITEIKNGNQLTLNYQGQKIERMHINHVILLKYKRSAIQS